MVHPLSGRPGHYPTTSQQSPSNAGQDRRLLWTCVLVVILSVLATVPVLEMGVNDDWSYTFTALKLAQTGRLLYNGDATAMIGAQAYWAALWIKLFGFSFTLVRLTTLPLAAGCAALLYSLSRRAGLGQHLAMFGTLLFVTSPIFVPVAASFMSDVPGAFFLLLSVYAGVRAFKEAPSLSSFGWLTLLALGGDVGGTIRQVIWICPVCYLPYLAWLRRENGRFTIVSGSLWLVSLFSIAACTYWYRAQPYAIVESPTEGIRPFLHLLPWSLSLATPFVLTTVLLLLPLLIGWSGWKMLRQRPVLALPVAAAAFLPLLIWHSRVLMPWSIQNLVTMWGPLGEGVTSVGTLPIIMPLWVRAALSAATFASLTLLLIIAAQAIRTWLKHPSWSGSGVTMREQNLVVVLLWLFVAIYTPPIIMRALTHGSFDRYLLLILPAVVISVCRYQARILGDRVSILGWGMLAIYGLFAIASTHDYLAGARARLTAATALVNVGIPRTEIMASLEYDGWTQIAQMGYLNDPRIRVPVGAYFPRPHEGTHIETMVHMYSKVPAVRLHYFVVMSPQPDLQSMKFSPITYTAWLPPFRRQVWTQQLLKNQTMPVVQHIKPQHNLSKY